MNMMENIALADLVILAAAVAYFVGYLIINQVHLRLAVLLGTLLYIWYYTIAASEPLWTAIITSVLIGAANLFGLIKLLMRGAVWIIPREHRDIYPFFDLLPPGDFRDLVLLADRVSLPQGTVLTVEDTASDHLYFVFDQPTLARKQGREFTLPKSIFVGEVGFLTGGAASATTTLTHKAEVLRWDVTALRTRSNKDVRFKLSLDAVISIDLAEKVARSGALAPSDEPAADAQPDLPRSA